MTTRVVDYDHDLRAWILSIPEFADAHLPHDLSICGRIRRFQLDPRDHKMSGWIVVYHLTHGVWAMVGSWRTGERHEYRSWTTSDPHTRAAVRKEFDELRKNYDAQLREKAARAAEYARRLVSRLRPTTDWTGHEWAARKKLSIPLRRTRQGVIVVPLVDERDVIVGAQLIASDGSRRFVRGTRARGARFVIGSIADASMIIVCEGVSTGDALHRATRLPVVCAMSAGNLEPVATSIRRIRQDATIIIVADNDARIVYGVLRNPGLDAARAAARTARALVACPPEPGTDAWDVLDRHGPSAVAAIVAAAEPPPPPPPRTHGSQGTTALPPPTQPGREDADDPNGAADHHRALRQSAPVFRTGPKGHPYRDVDNVARFIEAVLADRLVYDEFTGTLLLDNSPNHVTERVLAELFDAASSVPWTVDVVAQGLEYAVATRRVTATDSLRAALEAIPDDPFDGDGVDWFHLAVTDGMILERDYDPDLAAAVLRTWMIGAVARILEPGHKVDTALVLQGPQGIGKSSLLKALALHPTWFTDALTMHRLDNKDELMQLMGVHIVEMPELVGLRKAELNSIKKWLTQTVDRYRPPYGRSIVTLPRRFVIAATTNEHEYLRDTENRRFMILRVAEINLDWFAAHRDHLYAAARRAFAAGEEPILGGEPAKTMKDEHERASERDPWEETILAMLEARHQVTVTEILEHLGVPLERRTHVDAVRVGRILARAKHWRHARIRQGAKLVWVYRRVDPGST